MGRHSVVRADGSREMVAAGVWCCMSRSRANSAGCACVGVQAVPYCGRQAVQGRARTAALVDGSLFDALRDRCLVLFAYRTIGRHLPAAGLSVTACAGGMLGCDVY